MLNTNRICMQCGGIYITIFYLNVRYNKIISVGSHMNLVTTVFFFLLILNYVFFLLFITKA